MSRRTAWAGLAQGALWGALLACTAGGPNSVAAASGVDYDITVRVDPVARILEGSSVITADIPGERELVLAKRFEVTHARLNGKPLGPPSADGGAMQAWHLPSGAGSVRRIEIRWRGELSPLDRSIDHRQTLGAAEPVSGADGTFLPDASGWYPRITGVLPRYRLSLELPGGQRGLVPGRLVEESESDAGYRARFAFDHPAEGIDLMAGPYRVETETLRGKAGRPIRLRTYFHSPIAGLSRAYLDAVSGYLAFYESWIGAYPFSEFSVVSSPTPTGFGMPTLTYLGVDVLRLPFIRATSLGHEVLHNWWGNGVYPDYARGNWSEGLTTFMADYAYRERENAESARELRLAWLRDFAALRPAQDAPLAAFTSRTHGASQIVGYNKAAMVFLMLRDHIGRDAFDRGIRALWRERRFRITSWADLRHAFESESGDDLGAFFAQWLERRGAPSLRLAGATSARAGAGYRVMATLSQAAPAYRLRVPIAVRTETGVVSRTVSLDSERQVFALDVRDRPLEVALDPELRVFRRLAPGEAPPILRQVMVDGTTVTVLLPARGEARAAARRLAEKLQDYPPRMLSPEDDLPAAPVLVIGLREEIDDWLARRGLPGRPESLRGRGSAQAWTARRADGATLAIVSARDAASLAALARPLPHYGRQSYVVFDGARAISRGAWPARPQALTLPAQSR